MKIYDNGIYRDMTQKEIEEYNKNDIEIQQEPTLEERVSELERINKEQSELINSLVLFMKGE